MQRWGRSGGSTGEMAGGGTQREALSPGKCVHSQNVALCVLFECFYFKSD